MTAAVFLFITDKQYSCIYKKHLNWWWKTFFVWWSTVYMTLQASPGGIRCDLFIIQKKVCWLQQLSLISLFKLRERCHQNSKCLWFKSGPGQLLLLSPSFILTKANSTTQLWWNYIICIDASHKAVHPQQGFVLFLCKQCDFHIFATHDW